mmetsp:Transcript_15492/g.34084  ORF Transcript_15492/g.34084 Transcript_15492/m.34084 type:complete len:135 (-) Transcript_15492:28-432(-)
MAFDSIKGLSPAMCSRYWEEALAKENSEHVYHSLNSAPGERKSRSERRANPNDFYAGGWYMLERRYDQAAGTPSALVQMARRQVGASAPRDARPMTGASIQSRRSCSSKVSSKASSMRSRADAVPLPPPWRGSA